MNRALSNDTIDSVLLHQEVGRAEDLSAPLRKIGDKPPKFQLNVTSKDGNIVFKIHMPALSYLLENKSACGRQSFHYG